MKPYACLPFFALFLLPSVLHAATNPVPFSSQAPFGDWQQPWQDACEETTIIMVDAWYSKKSLSPSSAKESILHVFRLKENTFGKSLDENAVKMTELINRYFSWEATVVRNPSLAQMKKELDQGRPIILPAYGKGLANPNYQSGGPYYHTIVLTGYDDETNEFISNDPGTHLGLDFRYSYDRILDAMHDFLPNQRTMYGQKVAIFTRPDITTSATLDGDADGLSKEEELRFGSILWLKDSDGDGYNDGEEVRTGHSPTRREVAQVTLVKLVSNPRVYHVENGVKRHIANEDAFRRYGYRWQDIRIVNEQYLRGLREGTTIQ